MGKLHVILACDESRSPALPDAGRCEPCGVKRPPCQLYGNMKSTSTLKSEHWDEVDQIKKIFNSVILKWWYIW